MRTPDEVTTRQAAEIIGVTHSSVTRYCASGDLAHRRVGRTILIRRRDAKQFKRKPRGNPGLQERNT